MRFAALALLTTTAVQAQTPSPRVLEVPSAFATIQAAIDSSHDGDTVLVAPGRYVEHVRFGGHSIALVSRFARTRNPADILATIIDGSGPGHPDSASAVMIVDREDSTTVLEGFTIVGGRGTVWFDAAGRIDFREGGGVLCELSSPTIRFNRIVGNVAVAPVDRPRRLRSSGGGGIRCGYAEPTIEGNLIRGNRGRYGAGLTLFHSASVVRYNVIAENMGGEDFGGAGAWVVQNLSRRLSTVFEWNSLVGNVVLARDSGVTRTIQGRGGAAVFGAVNIEARHNLIAGNRQPATRQVDLGPRLGGTVTDNEERAGGADWRSAALAPARTGALAGPDAGRYQAVLRALVAAPDPEGTGATMLDLRLRRTELLAADRGAGAASRLSLADQLSAPLAPEAIAVGPRGIVWRGPTAVRQALMADSGNAGARVTWEPIRADVSADGAEGYTYGYLRVIGGRPVRAGWKYLAYWRRTDDGRWRMLAYKRLPHEPGDHPAAPPPGFETPTSAAATWYPAGPGALAALFGLDSAFAKAAQGGAQAAFLQYTATDGATLGGGPDLAWGREKVAAEFAAFTAGTIDWYPEEGVLAPGGDLGFASGPVIIREKRADGTLAEVARGRYLTIWKRQRDGSWKLVIDG